MKEQSNKQGYDFTEHARLPKDIITLLSWRFFAAVMPRLGQTKLLLFAKPQAGAPRHLH